MKLEASMRKGLAADKIIVHKILWNISITGNKAISMVFERATEMAAMPTKANKKMNWNDHKRYRKMIKGSGMITVAM